MVKKNSNKCSNYYSWSRKKNQKKKIFRNRKTSRYFELFNHSIIIIIISMINGEFFTIPGVLLPNSCCCCFFWAPDNQPTATIDQQLWNWFENLLFFFLLSPNKKLKVIIESWKNCKKWMNERMKSVHRDVWKFSIFCFSFFIQNSKKSTKINECHWWT